MYKFGTDRFDEWWLGAPYVGLEGGRLLEWAQGNDDECMSSHTNGGDYWEPVCAMDGMVHPGKGLLGLKITNVDNAIIDSGSIKVHNLFDFTPLGEDDICISASNNLEKMVKEIGSEQTPYQMAFSMNQIMGISIESSNIECKENVNFEVKNLKSSTGRVLGMTAWYGSKIKLYTHSTVTINDLFAGTDVEQGMFKYLDIPNHAPEACGFGAFESKAVSPTIEYVDNLDSFYDTKFDIYCIHGHYGCWGKEDELETYTNVGSYDKKQECEFKRTSNRKMKQNSRMEEEEQEKEMVVETNVFIGYNGDRQSTQQWIVVVSAVVMLVFALLSGLIWWLNGCTQKSFKYIPIQ